jgi:hypothetical protein
VITYTPPLSRPRGRDAPKGGRHRSDILELDAEPPAGVISAVINLVERDDGTAADAALLRRLQVSALLQ